MWPFSSRKKARSLDDAHACENPRAAHSVREEYLHVTTRLCKCGARLEGHSHELRYHDGLPRDVLHARCTRCRSFYCFVYDITSFFAKSNEEIGKTEQSELLDIMDWAHYGFTCLHQSVDATGERQYQLLEDAIWAFEEMLKFYPPNGSLPFPTAFFAHTAVSVDHLRSRYPRHLVNEAINAAKTRTDKCDH